MFNINSGIWWSRLLDSAALPFPAMVGWSGTSEKFILPHRSRLNYLDLCGSLNLPALELWLLEDVFIFTARGLYLDVKGQNLKAQPST